MSNTNTESKSILARLLANEDLQVVHDPASSTASFDLKDRVLRLPVWEDMSNSLYDMLVGHEVAHALYTPSEDWKVEIDTLAKMHKVPYATVQQYVNVIEDARIERMIKAKFPGLRRDFLDSYVDLMNRDLFDLDGRSIADLPLIDRINLEFKVGLHAGETIPFSATEGAWVKRVESATTWSDVLDIANDLLATIIDDGQQEQPEEESDVDDSETGEGEGQQQGGGEATDEDSDSSESAGSSPAGDSDDDQQDDDSSDSGSDSDSDSESSPTDGDAQNGKHVPQSMTEQAFGKVQDSLRESTSGHYGAGEEMTIDPIDLDWNIIDYKTCHRLLSAHWSSAVDKGKQRSDIECAQFISKSKPTVNVLAKQFEMKKQADAHKRVQISKTGTLDTVKMMNYKWSEDVFRKTATVRDGKNHGLVMFLDWSGSMCDQIAETMEQMIQLVLFCKKVNIPFEVYAFSSDNPDSFGHEARDVWETNDHGFSLLNLFSSRMNRREFDEAILNNFALARSQTYDYGNVPTAPRGFSLGGTPLNEAILGAISIVPKFKSENNVQIVNTVFLTDGCGNGFNIPYKGTLKIKGDRIGVKVPCGMGATNLLTQMLRERTGCKIVNFFLTNWGPTKFNRYSYQYFRGDEEAQAKGLETWKKHNYAISNNDREGWDEQYLLRITKVNTDNGMQNIDDNATATKKKNAFLKSMGSKMTSRVVLGRFIDQIA